MEGKHNWEEVVSRKRRIQRDLLSLHANDGTQTQTTSRGDANSLTNMTAISELVAKLSRGELSCVGVMKAFISRSVTGLTIYALWQEDEESLMTVLWIT
jgi:hypothetical protein